MPPPFVVPGFDPAKQGQFGVFLVDETSLIYQFHFYRFKEALDMQQKAVRLVKSYAAIL